MIKWKSWKNFPKEKGRYLAQVQYAKTFMHEPLDAGAPYPGVLVCIASLRDAEDAWSDDILGKPSKDGLAWFVQDLYKTIQENDPRLKLVAWAPLSELGVPEFIHDPSYRSRHTGKLNVER